MTPNERARQEYRRTLQQLAITAVVVAAGFPSSLAKALPAWTPAAEAVPARSVTVRRRRKGGSLYRRGGVWRIKYYVAGRPIRESTRSGRREDAETLLDERFGQRASGETISPKAARLRVDELLDNLERRYRIDAQTAPAANLERLRTTFGRERAVSLTGAAWNVYVDRHRRTPEGPAGLSNATLNRDLAALRRAYTLARQDFPGFKTRVEFETLQEAAPRGGFFEPEQFEAVRRHLPAYLRPVATFGYLTGWRKSEVLELTWSRVSFADGEVRLDPGTTKNGDGRAFPFTDELGALLEAQRSETDARQRKTGRIVPFVFHHNGRPIRDFRRAWAAACTAAGCPGRIFHDFRRSAVRRFEQAGIARSVAMKLTGHKTENVYRRYAIVSDRELREAAATLSRRGNGHNSGHSRSAIPVARQGGAG